ncbi:branched-chain amino acid ABC transporter permease [Nonomuraea fuscirosea]|jgi:neutral amino acid transport system permease protein|uniref:Amino acid/amide ABC transporter membrane protein 2 (HAAT family) n=1 Tax=Nonomuraea fuscirosea TaxID=1291556 RepID=A0A2T0MVA9_9ACTN|nr:branched-chain amino acid ABC transporter permease [Nonomuraea fuscirosea]PRX62748.1 amino acid/amide ABC transporter membrane protein 2 (HAAT family) [Nonomuraea fuscirosea]WSA47885.1 branched-chain amino acid ABC transporter permease [Nonomuraea fuscirosea]
MDWLTIITTTVHAAIGWESVVYGLAAIGVNIHFGYTGLLNFGQAAFMAVAGYGLAVAVTVMNLPFWMGIVIGLAAAAILALLLGIPTLQLRADYLAIVTIAAAEIVRLVFRSVYFKDIFGGSDGRRGFTGDFYAMNPFPPGHYGIGPFGFDERVIWFLAVGWSVVLLSCLVVYLLMKSPWGRVLKAIREDEDAVRALGKNVFSYKMQSLMLGGIIGCLAGFFYGLYNGAVQPDIFGTEMTFFAYTIVILGGAARVFGPVVGAMIFWVLFVFVGNTLAELVRNGFIPFMTTTQVGPIRYALVGLGFILLLVIRPQGIFGDKREIAINAR